MRSLPRWEHTHSLSNRISAGSRVVLGVLCVLSIVLVFGSASNAFGQATVGRTLVVRSYNTMGVSLTTLEHAELTVQGLLESAGISSGWRNCHTPDGPSARSRDLCDDVLDASEVIVRIVRTPRTIADPEALGYSYVDPYRRQGTMATVFADRVRSLAPTLRIDEGTLLGRAITHEVGHLLLGTLEHSETGLMRGTWNTPSRSRTNWLFSPAEATRMHEGLAARRADQPNAAPSALLAQGTRR